MVFSLIDMVLHLIKTIYNKPITQKEKTMKKVDIFTEPQPIHHGSTPLMNTNGTISFGFKTTGDQPLNEKELDKMKPLSPEARPMALKKYRQCLANLAKAKEKKAELEAAA